MEQFIVKVDGLPVLVSARTEKQAAIAARHLVGLSKVAAKIPAAKRHARGGLGL